MNSELERIHIFIQEHHLLMLSTFAERLWCCSLFYVYDAESISFIVASDEKTEHIRNSMQNPQIAGTVALETKTVGKIQGIQFRGIMSLATEKKELYYKAFPYALAMNPTLWSIRLDEIKFTDNRLGFGKKISWKREL